MINNADVQEWDRLISGVTRRKAAKFPDVDHEDLHQDVWIRVLSEGATYDPNQRGIRTLVNLWASSAATDIRKENLYNSPQYFYTPDDVRRILDTLFYDVQWGEGYAPPDSRSQPQSSWTDVLDVRADVSASFKNLSVTEKRAIFERYALGEKPATSSAKEKRLNRAIDELVDQLNWYYRSKLYKRSKSNSAMRATIEDQEDK